ncbi:MAG: cytochrome P450 [Proteobacteria bacterium]|nr:MAG: cytochrome P450 [Pseudomonadota bacterium]
MKLPQPRPYPILGNLLDLNLDTPIQTMMELAKRYGPIYRLKVPTEDLVVVSSAALTQELCNEARFDKKVHGPLDVVRDYAGDGLITAHTREPNWEKAHRILLPAFGGGALRPMFSQMLDVAEQMVLKWERQGPRHPIDVSDDMTRLTVDTIALCGFGYRLNSFYDREMHPFVGAMMRSLTESSARTRRPPLTTNFLFRKKRRYDADRRLMHALADEIIASRKGNESEGRDVLSTMLSAADPVTGEKLDDENIRHQMVTFLIAGHETTSGLLSFALYELMRNPSAMAQARAEVETVLGHEPPTFDSMPRLSYLDQILKETLRLWPTAPAFAVYSREPTAELAGQYSVDAKQTILLLLPSIGRDPAVWEDPESFRPERMAREQFDQIPDGAWKPFGNGQRACIGRAFALQEATLALALVLQRFDLSHVVPGIPLRIRESLTLKPDGFRVFATPRKAVGEKRKVEARGESTTAKMKPLLFLYGSKTGTAQSYAEEMAAEANAHGYAPEVAPLDDYATRPLEGHVVIFSASYDGRPPDNAKSFHQALARAENGAFAGLSYAVFGCGNRDWARTYQAIPKLLDRRFEELGARRFFERGEGDARGDSRGDFLRWKECYWARAVATEFSLAVLPAEGEAEVPAPGPLAARALKLFGLDSRARLLVSGGNFPKAGEVILAGAFFSEAALARPVSPAAMKQVAEAIRCPPEKKLIAELGQRPDAQTRPSLLEILERCPSAIIPLTDFAAYLED